MKLNPKDPKDAFDRVINWIKMESSNNQWVNVWLERFQKLHHYDMQSKASTISSIDQALKAHQKLVLVLEDKIEDLNSIIQNLEFEKLKAKNCCWNI